MKKKVLKLISLLFKFDERLSNLVLVFVDMFE